jgi:integrase
MAVAPTLSHADKARRNATLAELIVPNTKGKPNSLHIEVVKRVAHRAKLNCGQCVTKHGNRCAAGPYCQRFYLHKFRHTIATEHPRHGIDVRTLQGWMGHRDIQSTMVYLKGRRSDSIIFILLRHQVGEQGSANEATTAGRGAWKKRTRF